MSQRDGGYGVKCACGLHAPVTYRWEADRTRDEHKVNTGHDATIWKRSAGGHWLYPVAK